MATLSLIVAAFCVIAAALYWRHHTRAPEPPKRVSLRPSGTSDRPRSYPPSATQRSKLGLSVPPGRFTRGLADPDRDNFRAAVANISALAVAGDPSGLDELEDLIGVNTERGFHDFKRRNTPARESDPQRTLMDMAREGSLFTDVNRARSSVPPLAKQGEVAGTVRSLRDRHGERSARELELLYAQLSISQKYRRQGLRT